MTHRTKKGELKLSPADKAKRYVIRGMAALHDEPPLNWLVKDWIVSREFACFWGSPGTYKSFIAQGLSLQLASEGRKTLYVAAEGSSGLAARVHAWNALNFANAYREDEAWHYMPMNVDMANQLERRRWANDVLDVYPDGPDLIVLDTLARNFHGDENSAKEMGQFVEGVEEIRRDLETAVWVIHHSNVSQDNRRERGTAALRAATFSMYEVSDPRDTKYGISVELKCDRMKDADEPKPVRVDLMEVGLDTDEHGDIYRTSLAMRPFPDRAARRKGVKPNQKKRSDGSKTDKEKANKAINRARGRSSE